MGAEDSMNQLSGFDRLLIRAVLIALAPVALTESMMSGEFEQRTSGMVCFSMGETNEQSLGCQALRNLGWSVVFYSAEQNGFSLRVLVPPRGKSGSGKSAATSRTRPAREQR